jgi:hypothetical protein
MTSAVEVTSTPRWLRLPPEPGFSMRTSFSAVVDGEVGVPQHGGEELGVEGAGGVDVVAVEGELHAGMNPPEAGGRASTAVDVCCSVWDSPSTTVND